MRPPLLCVDGIFLAWQVEGCDSELEEDEEYTQGVQEGTALYLTE